MSLAAQHCTWTLVLFALLPLAPAQEEVNQPQPPGPITLEKLSRIARNRAKRNQAAGKKELQRRLNDLSLSWEDNREFVERAVGILASRGPDLSPLLLPYLDPGSNSVKDRNLAANISRVLKQIGISPLIPELTRMSCSAKPLGRELAIDLLGGSNNPAVLPTLMAGLKDPEPQVVGTACLALARFNHSPARGPLLDLLQRKESKVKDAALRALYKLSKADDLGRILAAITTVVHEETIMLLMPILEKFGQGNSKVQQRLLTYVQTEGLSLALKQDAAELLGKVTPPKDKRIITALKKVLKDKTAYAPLRKQVAFTLNDLGDKSGHSVVLADANRFIKNSPKVPYAFVRRAEIYFKLHIYNKAATDFAKAISLCRGRFRAEPSTYIDLFRCYAFLGRHRDIVRALKKSSLSKHRLKEAVETYPEIAEVCKKNPALRKLMTGK